MIDIHAHLQDSRLRPFLPQALALAKQLGVVTICTSGTSPTDWHAVASLAQAPQLPELPTIVPAFGVHPWYVESLPNDWAETLAHFLEAHPRAMLGECGLDGVRHEISPTIQQTVFETQIQLAKHYQRPLIMHGARIWDRLLALLRPSAAALPALVAHSFGGSLETLRAWLAIGGFVSISGTVCNPRAKRVRAVAQMTPDDRLLVETDAPDMFPLGGKCCPKAPGCDLGRVRLLNHPANLKAVIAAVATLRQTSVEEVARLTTTNARRILQY